MPLCFANLHELVNANLMTSFEFWACLDSICLSAFLYASEYQLTNQTCLTLLRNGEWREALNRF